MPIINGKNSIFVQVQPPDKVKQQLQSPNFYINWTNAAHQIGSDHTQQTAEVYFVIKGKQHRTEVDDTRDQALQSLANEQQRTVVRTIKKESQFFRPHRPKKVRIYTENKEGYRTLINEVDTPSKDFKTRCEDYASKHGVDVVVAYKTGGVQEFPALPPNLLASIRKYKPQMSKCRKCGSITCAGVGSTGISCGRTAR